MAITVRVPTQLRKLTDGVPEVQATGATVAELIEDLERNHPGMRNRLMDDNGSIRRFVNVYLNDEDVRFLGGVDATIPEGAQVSIIPAVAGG